MSDTGDQNDRTGGGADEAPYADPIEEWDEANDLVTNDAVAGETILPGAGDGNNGPTGGSPGEAQPVLDEHGLETEDIDLDDESDAG
jgi:hypothetical protein